MTFKHSAFVKITYAEKRKEAIEFLKSIGYNKWAFYFEYDGIQTFLDGTFTDTCSPVEDNDIDCGDKIELFKAIVAINDENDYMQWFINGDKSVYKRCNTKSWTDERLIFPSYTKATAEQLTEYFKNR